MSRKALSSNGSFDYQHGRFVSGNELKRSRKMEQIRDELAEIEQEIGAKRHNASTKKKPSAFKVTPGKVVLQIG